MTMSITHTTKNDLPKKTRKTVIGLLNEDLADAIHLSLQAKQAHWNVKGPAFFPLHELFDKLYDEAGDWADLLAERAVQLGGVAEGTLAQIAKQTKLQAYPTDLAAGRDHLAALIDSLSAFARSVRRAAGDAGAAGDADTEDLFTEISRGADKMLWFLEAHLQADN